MCVCTLRCARLFGYTIDYSPPDSSAHGFIPTGILEWVANSFTGDLPHPGIEPTFPMSLSLAGGFFIIESPGKPLSRISSG